MQKQPPAIGVRSQESPGVDFPGAAPPHLPLEASVTTTNHQEEKSRNSNHKTPYQRN